MQMNIVLLTKTLRSLFKPVLVVAMMLIGGSVIAQPINDEPCDAITLNVGSTCNYEQFTTLDATSTLGYPDPSCGDYQGNDVWFQVTVPAEGSLIFDTNTGDLTDADMAIYSGDCNNLTEIACDDLSSPNGFMPLISLTGLTPGETLWIRIWSFGNDEAGTFSICVSTPPPPPVNDEPCDAITVNVNSSCVFETFSNASATATLGYPDPTCANYQGGDVWFQVTVPAGGALIFDSNTGVITDGGMAIYSGDCNNLTQIACDDDSSPNGLMPQITLYNLTPGESLWIRFWEYGGNNNGTFQLCVTTPPPPPANDNCIDAVSLTVNPDLNCAATITGTTISASPSVAPVPDPTCQVAGANDDVWYSFVATSTAHTISFTNVTGNVTDLASELYSGTCDGLVSVGCFNPNVYSVGGLTVGTTYYLRVWTVSTSTNGANYTLCIGTPPPPPSNDNPCEAITLTATETCNLQTFTTASATSSGNVPAPGCANYQGGDVWFQVTVPAVGGIIVNSEATNPAGITDGGMAIYSGTCDNLTLIECDDDDGTGLMPYIVHGGLTPGETIWIRYWEYGNDNPGTFQICVTIPPPPPSNDEPCSAILLPIAQDGSCNYQTFSNYSATQTTGAGIPAPGCGNFTGGDVWFKAVVPCSGTIKIDSKDIFVTDGAMALYTGTCDNMTLVECDDNDSPNGAMPLINASGLTPGDTVWIRFWEYGNNVFGDFGICASIPPPPPPASSCPTAQPFCTGVPFNVPSITDQPNTNGGGPYGCLFTIPNPTFYYIQIQNPGDITIQIHQVSTAGNTVDVDFVLWGPFTQLTDACAGVDAANIIDCSYSTAGIEFADITGAVAGQFYLLMVTNFSNQPGTITYTQTAGSGSSNCGLVCTTSATNTGPVCPGTTVDLGSSAVTDANYQWTGPNCFSSTLQNPTGVTAPTDPGTYTYTIVATGPNGYACTDTTHVIVAQGPALGVDQNTSVCENGTVDLTSLFTLTGLTTTWTNFANGNPVANPAAVSNSGTYQLAAATAFGCKDTALVTVVIDTVRSTVSYQQVPCTQTAVITVNATQGASPFEYGLTANPGVFQPGNEFTVESAGTYTTVVRDDLGCTYNNDVVVSLLPPFTVDAGDPISIIIGDAVTLTPSANQSVASYLWSPATGLSSTSIANPVATPTQTITYTLTATTAEGCEATDTVTVTVIPICIEVRNAFTPNGDGINELWQVYRSYECFRNISVQVFNRYGNTVYESKDYRNQWDGTYKGKPVPDGTYYAVVKFTQINGKVVTIKSDVTVLR